MTHCSGCGVRLADRVGEVRLGLQWFDQDHFPGASIGGSTASTPIPDVGQAPVNTPSHRGGLLLMESIAGRDLAFSAPASHEVWVEVSMVPATSTAVDADETKSQANQDVRVECTEAVPLMDVSDVGTLQWRRQIAFEDAAASALLLRVVSAKAGTGEERRVHAVGQVSVPLEARVNQLATSVPLPCHLRAAGRAGDLAAADSDADVNGDEGCGRLRVGVRCLPFIKGMLRAQVVSVGPLECVGGAGGCVQ